LEGEEVDFVAEFTRGTDGKGKSEPGSPARTLFFCESEKCKRHKPKMQEMKSRVAKTS
jgi:hypothetical protein